MAWWLKTAWLAISRFISSSRRSDGNPFRPQPAARPEEIRRRLRGVLFQLRQLHSHLPTLFRLRILPAQDDPLRAVRAAGSLTWQQGIVDVLRPRPVHGNLSAAGYAGRF